MDLALTQTQRQLADTARRYLSDNYPAERVAAIAKGDGLDAAAWPELVRQGWLDPDLGMVELALLAQESGYALHPTPWWTTVALTGLTAPSTLVTGDITVRLEGDHWLLSGHAALVPDAASAAVLAVKANGAWFTVGKDAAEVRECASLDRLRRMYEVDFRDVPARQIIPHGPERAAALLAGEAVGVAARAMDFAVDHAKVREQFGRPIGSFQAVAHQLAEGYVELELARSLALRAAWLVGEGGNSGEQASALACAVIAGRRAAVRCCEIAIQTLGGMGVTWEHPLHLWFRRALWLEAFAGIGQDPHATLAASLLDETAVAG